MKYLASCLLRLLDALVELGQEIRICLRECVCLVSIWLWFDTVREEEEDKNKVGKPK
jgi:hypothetical protein